MAVLFAVDHSDAIRRQLGAYEIWNVYNLRNLSEDAGAVKPYRYDLPYHFIDRSKKREYLCYVLAGYEPELWDTALARIEAFQSKKMGWVKMNDLFMRTISRKTLQFMR